MKLLIGMPLWKRPVLTRIVLGYYQNLAREIPGITLLAVGSEGHNSFSSCFMSDWNYIEYPNLPLASKLNALSREVERYDADAMMLVGSDNLISRDIIKYYMNQYGSATPEMIGMRGCYYYDVNTDTSYHLTDQPGESRKYSMGAGRLFSKKVLEKTGYNLWDATPMAKGLDYSCSKRLEYLNINHKVITMEQAGGIVLDIKEDESINPVSYLRPFVSETSSNIFRNNFPAQYKLVTQYYNTPVRENA